MKNVHILLVEDNEGDIVLTIESFNAAALKNKISVARDGEEALEFLYQKGKFADVEKPDLVLLDINIPKLNGHEVLDIIRKDDDLKKIPVIMLTTSSASSDLREAYNNHVNSYIVKPIELIKFMEAIAQIENFWLTLMTIPKN